MIDLEKKFVAGLLYRPSDVKNINVELNWLFNPNYKAILDVIQETNGEESDFIVLAEKIKDKYPASSITFETIYEISTNAVTSAHLPKYAKELEYRYVKDKLAIASNRFATDPTEKNKEQLKEWMMKLDQTQTEEDDGNVRDAIEEIYYSLENENEPGILTYPMIDETLGGGMHGGTLITIGARPGLGKAHPDDTLIPTPNGQTRIGDLKVGDYVFDRKGKPTRVKGVYPRGEMETYRVTLNDGRSTVTAADHIWSYFSMSGSGKESLVNKTTLEMYEAGTHVKKKKPNGRISHHAKYSIPTNGAVEFEDKQHSVDPYVIGALIGDGCLRERALTISSDDEPVVRKIADCLGISNVEKSKHNYNWKFKLNEPFKNRKWVKTKEVLDLFPEITTYSRLKKIPEEYLFTGQSNRMRLLNGLFDTDGHAVISKGKLSVGYTTSSKEMAKQIRWLLQSCGYLSSMSLDIREGRTDCYNLSVNAQPEQLKDLFTLERKRNVVVNNDKKRVRKYDRIAIKSIEKTGLVEKVTCIAVENEEHLYLCNDFIVTHNTAFGVNLAIEAVEKQPDISIDFFTLEMSKKQMVNRFISRIGEINSYKLRNPNSQLDANEKQKVISATSILLNSNFKIHDKLFSLGQIERRIRKSHFEADGKPYVAFVDYLGLIDVSDTKQPRHVQIGEITRTMKILTNELDIPIVLFTQLNRGIESRQDKEPLLSDIRESGSVEQDIGFMLKEYCNKTRN